MPSTEELCNLPGLWAGLCKIVAPSSKNKPNGLSLQAKKLLCVYGAFCFSLLDTYTYVEHIHMVMADA